jgi:putative transcriptional regulator
MTCIRWGAAALLALVLISPAAALASGDAMILVARPQVKHPVYARTVLVVAPFGDGQHYGFIVNRPTALRLEQMFPRHAPSREVDSPVFLGGPVYAGFIFALFEGDASPASGCLRMMPGLHAAFVGRAVDRVIESHPHDARFVTGLVVWRPGELARELAGRMWYVLEPDASLVSRDPRGLWAELVVRAQSHGRMLGADALKPHRGETLRVAGDRGVGQHGAALDDRGLAAEQRLAVPDELRVRPGHEAAGLRE